MRGFFTPLLRRLYGFLAAFVLVYGLFSLGQYTDWNKERLYRKLVSGDRDQKLSAGFDLAWLGGQPQLLRALRSSSGTVREVAADSLWNLWYHAAGRRAYQLVQSANLAMERQDFSEAVGILNRIVARYPAFAEGWNRRAILYWQTGQFEKAITDCRKVVSLNPNHFGAWHGMALCQLQVGDLPAACHSLRAALRINPHDRSLQRFLEQCEELLRRVSPERPATIDWV